MKPRHIAMGAALLLAAGLVVFGDNTPEDTVAEPVERAAQAPARAAAPAASTASTPSNAASDTAILRLLPRETLIGGDDRFGAADNALFARQDWAPPPPPPSNEPPPPPPPPTAPPLPFTFIGKSLQDGAWEVYLARGDRTYLVRDKTTIDGTYRVDAIRPPVMTLTYLPLEQVQQINIGVFE
ncbi:hypothetical protein [Massilia sp. YIM B02443]|uniref:hypothetical protein n=1 Tax=Massilia sp. YIM B02443 TaxID=3050127 RepID=UPI0025B7249C|nr:hypothetical protein [Massilia sp. YIM B02443]MDN4036585.1 hypothetical protein [Massilia sp. YIM B02443]